MDEQKKQVILQLMGELEELMQPTGDELGERLGKPKMEIEIESSEPMEGEEMAMDGAMEMEGPEEKLKQRLMKMRE